jgi:hypothetical protein
MRPASLGVFALAHVTGERPRDQLPDAPPMKSPGYAASVQIGETPDGLTPSNWHQKLPVARSPNQITTNIECSRRQFAN